MFSAARRKAAVRFAITLGLSAGGGLAAYLVGLPAAWISGGLVLVAAASLAGVNTEVPALARAPAFLVLGIYSGAGVSQETLRQMQTWPGSFAILAVSVVALIAASYLWLTRRSGWDRNTALLASMPGALSFVIAAAEDLKADLKKVAIAQSIRVLVLIELIPPAAILIGHAPRDGAIAAAPAAGMRDLIILFAAGAATSVLFERLKLPAAWMLGGLLPTALLVLTGSVDAHMPAMLVLPATVILAAIVGSRFRPGDLALLPRIAGPALAALALAIAISVAAAGAVTVLFGVNFVQTLLAFAPGALDVLILLAYELNIDPAYVAAHHVVRFLALVAAVPLLARWLDRHP